MQVNEKISILQNLIKRKVTYEEIAKILGLGSGQALRNRVTRKQPLKDYEEKLIDDFFNIEIEKNKTYLTNKNDSITADYYPDIFGSCGGGAFVLSENKVQVQIPKTSFFKNISSFRKYSVINAIGESMLPLIQDKDKLIVEHFESGDQIQDNRIYVFSYLDSIFVKRLVKNINELIIISDNPDKNIYKNICLQKDDMNNIYIIGQIVGLMRDLR